MTLPYQAAALQDRFVANLLNFKENGYFLDIGSCDAISCNNTYCFEELGWKGICIEMDTAYNDNYAKRKCKYINTDATKIDYLKLFKENHTPEIIDYLSLDIDERSTEVLKQLPFKEYRFRVITIEHDLYIHGDKYKKQQVEILTSAGYSLMCDNVMSPLTDGVKPNSEFEDWWVMKDLIDVNRGYFCVSKYANDIVNTISK